MRRNQFVEPPQISEGARWYCMTTATNLQKRVCDELYPLGYRTFYPRLKKWVSHARTRKAVERPLLGRYVFVEVDYPRQDFRTLGQIYGVQGLVGNYGTPRALPSWWVTDFMERYLAGEWDEVTPGTFQYRDEYGNIQTRENGKAPTGARIRIIEGEFAMVLATITSQKNGRVHCKIFGQNKYVHLSEQNIRAA
jgi:transcription antitermination factor NusG